VLARLQWMMPDGFRCSGLPLGAIIMDDAVHAEGQVLHAGRTRQVEKAHAKPLNVGDRAGSGASREPPERRLPFLALLYAPVWSTLAATGRLFLSSEPPG
jgi:hypothetical protein